MITAYGYFKTGFDGINRPFNEAALEEAAGYDTIRRPSNLGVMDIVGIYDLTTIKINSQSEGMNFIENIRWLDYIKLIDEGSGAYAFYQVPGTHTKSSYDVFNISVVMDEWLTYVNPLSIDKFKVDRILKPIGGQIVRTTNPQLSDDDVDKYSLMDDLPQNQRYSRVYQTLFGHYSSDDNDGVTYDLVNHGTTWTGDNIEYNLYASNYDVNINQDSLQAVTSPVKITKEGENNYTFSSNYNTTAYTIGQPASGDTTIWMGPPYSPHPGVIWQPSYVFPSAAIYDDEMLKTARTLYNFGIANPIIDAYVLPDGFCKLTKENNRYTKVAGEYGTATMTTSIPALVAPVSDYDPIIGRVIINSTVKIKLTAYGSGQSEELPWPELYGSQQGEDKIYVRLFTDPTPNGAPYYKLVNKQNFDNKGRLNGLDTLNGAVRGASWQRCPVTYAGYNKQTALNVQSIRQTMAAAEDIRQTQTDAYVTERNLGKLYGTSLISAVGEGVNTAMNSAGSMLNVDTSSMLDSAVKFGTNKYDIDTQVNLNNMNKVWRNYSKAAEQAEFATTHAAVDVKLDFAITDSLQPIMGNGALLEIKYPQYADVTNMIRYLQRYGVPISKTITNSEDIFGGIEGEWDYIYVQTSGIQFDKTYCPSMAAMALSDTFNRGVRFWNKHPDSTAYDKMFKKVIA